MYSWLVTVLLLASAAYCSGGQGAVEGEEEGWEGEVGWGWGVGGAQSTLGGGGQLTCACTVH